MGSNDWNLMAGLALEQILERNEKGNLYPLTSLETQVLNDIRDMIVPPLEDEKVDDQKPPADTPSAPEGKVGKKQQPPTKTQEKKDAGKRGFVPLDNGDMTG